MLIVHSNLRTICIYEMIERRALSFGKGETNDNNRDVHGNEDDDKNTVDSKNLENNNIPTCIYLTGP